MTGSALGHLLRPLEVGSHKGVGDEAPAMPADANQVNAATTESGPEGTCGLKHMRQHGAARHRMHDLGQVRAHAFAHASSQHHDIQNNGFVGQIPILGRVSGETTGESRKTAGAILTAQAHGSRAVLTIRRPVEPMIRRSVGWIGGMDWWSESGRSWWLRQVVRFRM